MKKDQKNSDSLLEIIFADRNKAYGAYQIRKQYDERLRTAFLTSLGFFGIVFFAVKVMLALFPGTDLPLVKPEVIGPMIWGTKPPKFKQDDVATTKPVVRNTDIINSRIVDHVRETEKKKPTMEHLSFSDNGNGHNAVIPSNSGTPGGNGFTKAGTDFTPVFFKKKEPKSIVEEMPSFPGGEEKMMEFIRSRIVFPKALVESDFHTAKANIRFVVDEEGNITDIRIVRDMGFGTGEEAAKVVGEMPKWIPGKEHGEAVPVYVTLPVTFDVK